MKTYRGLETTSKQFAQLEAVLHYLIGYCRNIIFDCYSKDTVKELVNELTTLMSMYDSSKHKLILTILFNELHEALNIFK